LVEKSEKSL